MLAVPIKRLAAGNDHRPGTANGTTTAATCATELATSGVIGDTRSSMRPAFIDSSAGRTEKKATSRPTISSEAPRWMAVSETLTRAPVKVMWFRIARVVRIQTWRRVRNGGIGSCIGPIVRYRGRMC